MASWEYSVERSHLEISQIQAASTNRLTLASFLVGYLNRVMMNGSIETPVVASKVCGQTAVPDFKPTTLVTAIPFDRLAEVPANGEIKTHGALTDVLTFGEATKAKQFARSLLVSL